jgi:predicted GH43/DUF377 family glycosyl hydrolase
VPREGIGCTKDVVDFKRISLATEVDNKEAVLFPEKFNDDYVMIDRPGGLGGQMDATRITYSKDLIHWGRAKAMMCPELGWGFAHHR